MQATLRPYWTLAAQCHLCRAPLARRTLATDAAKLDRLPLLRRPRMQYFSATTSHRQHAKPSESQVELEVQIRRLDLDSQEFGISPSAFVDYAAAAQEANDVDESELEHEEAVVEARQAFGDTLPEKWLDEDALKCYKRLYGEPVWEPEYTQVSEPDHEDVNPSSVDPAEPDIMVEGSDGALEEMQFEDELEDGEQQTETFEDILESPAFLRLRKSKKGRFFALATKKQLDEKVLFSEMTRSDEAALAYLDREWRRMGDDEKAVYLDDVAYMKLEQYLRDHDRHDDADELLQCFYIFLESQAAKAAETSAPEVQEGEFDPQSLAVSEEHMRGDEMDDADNYVRVHPLTRENRFSTSPSTLPLPTYNLTARVSKLISASNPTHLAETAQRLFGGPGLPYSTSNPQFAKSMPQKPIPVDMTQERVSDMEADAYLAAVMPGTYASVMSALVETRKRLGSDWLEELMNREGGPRILDAGGAGAGVIAFREMLRAEWERIHDDSDDPEAFTGLATVDGREGGAPAEPPYGRATVLVGANSLRQRASALLIDTTFVPRLPDYVHASDLSAAQRGKFDVIIAPHSLWSLKEESLRKQQLANLWSLLRSDGGVLILLEKGVPRGFEVIASARKFLLDTRIASPGNHNKNDDELDQPAEVNLRGVREKDQGMIIAPCTNHSACPMYTRSGISAGRKDYCHFEQRYVRPSYLQKLLDAKSKNHEDVKFSYLSIMRGRDLRHSQSITQDEHSTLAAFAGYEDPASNPSTAFDPTAPAISDVNTGPHSLTLPRMILPPLKRTGHVIIDVCTPAGTLERWTVAKSFSRQAFRDARKSAWGDLWALGAKTRIPKNVKLGGEGGHGIDLKKVNITAKGRKALLEKGGVKKKKAKQVYDVPVDPDTGRAREEDVRLVHGGRARTTRVKGVRDRRNKSGRVRVRKGEVEEGY